METLLRLSISSVSGLEYPGDWIDHFYILGFWIPFMYLLNYQETFYSHQAQPPLKTGFRSHLCPKPPSSFHSTPIYGECSPSEYLKILPGPQVACLQSLWQSAHTAMWTETSQRTQCTRVAPTFLTVRMSQGISWFSFLPSCNKAQSTGSWCLAPTFNIHRGLQTGQCRDWSLDTL